MVLSRAQIEKLAEIIRQHVTWFAWRVFGQQEVSEQDLQQLKASGKLPMDVSATSIRYAYVLGKLESLLKEGEFKKLTWAQLQEAAKGQYTDVDKLQIQAAELSVHTKFRNLLDDLKNDLYSRLAQETHQTITEGIIRDTIADKIKTGVDLGQSYTKVANELIGALKETKRDWGRLASTEMHSARQRGIVNAIIQKEDVYADSEGADSNVAISHDAFMCEDCRRLYYDPKTGNPKIFKLSELLENEGTNYQRPWRENAKPVIPPLHPHSIAAYAVVKGNTVAATRMLYVGQIREIKTIQGNTLPVTPNHPVATLRGFIPAGEVQKGDYLLTYNGGLKDDLSSGLFSISTDFLLPQNEQYRPATIEQVFSSLAMMRNIFSIRRFGDEFHGDASYGNGDIDIIYIDSKLGDGIQTTVLDEAKRLLLESSKFPASAISHQRLGTSFFVGDRVGLPQSIVGHFAESLESFLQVSNTLRVGATSRLDALLLELGSQFTSRDASFCGELQKRLPSLVTKDQVVEIRDRHYSGHVHDLQTVSGVIVAENLIVSNCYGRVRYIPAGWGWNDKHEFTLLSPEEAYPGLVGKP